jgi:DNA-binding SARP family transcriptional activator/tetratricopeptide (TPR) repeat protein
VEFRILGPLEVLDGDRPVPLPRGRGRALLALLVLNAGKVVLADRLIDDLWSEIAPSTARTALQGLVFDLRKRLEPSRRRGELPTLLLTAPPGYVLAVEPTYVDANQFRRLVEEARAGEAAERAAKQREALDLWRGRALADFTYEPFAQREIAALEELRIAVMEERIDADLTLGLASELVADIETLVAEHPSRERLRAQLMLALYRSGRQAEALEVYRDTRQALVEDLGIEPGPRLQQLEQAILRQDPRLEREPAPARTQVALEPPSPGKPWLQGERKIVTVAFLDLGASSVICDGFDPEALRRVVARSRDVAAEILVRHGATVEHVVGDVVVGVFGTPAAHEDDALRAVRAAIEVRKALGRANAPARPRIALPISAGIETGEVVVGGAGSGRPTVSGYALHVAARLQRAAADEDVLVGEETKRILGGSALLEPVDPLTPTAWRLVGLVPGAQALARHLDAPMVGRDADLARVVAAFERAVRDGAGHRLTVLGDAGIGKSRLGREVVAALGSRARILTGRCPAYGDGVTFWPLREVVLEEAGGARVDSLAELLSGEADGERIAAQIAAAIGLTQEPTRPDELFPAIRRIFEAVADRQPLVVVLEDVHWAEATFLDLIEYLADVAREPLFLLCLARPELLEARPAWGAASRNVDTVVLEPLEASEIQLIAERLAGGALVPDMRARVVETAQGNPLFAEQLVAALQDEHAVPLPASLHALLAARLDRLGPAERDLLRCAAVIGTSFTVDALTVLIPEQARPFVDRHLRALERKRLVRPSRPAGSELAFQHVLIQLAAYRSMTREDRATLHERFAEWLRAQPPAQVPSLDEQLGYHLEQAVAERRVLGVADEHDAELAVRAGEHLAAAGLRAVWRYDVAAAANLLSRAYELLPAKNPQRRIVMQRLAEAYQVVGRLDDAESALTTMLREAEDEDDLRLAQIARLELMRSKLFSGPDPIKLHSILEETGRALHVFREPADEPGLALAYYVRAYVHFRAAEMHEMEHAARQALAHADRSARLREAMAARILVAWAVAGGPTPVPEAIRACEQLVEVADREHPVVLCSLATQRAMLGKIDDARGLLERARELVLERMRGRSPMMVLALDHASVELSAGDVVAAERQLEVALELARAGRLRDIIAQTAARFSLVVVQRDPARAEALAALSRDNAPAEGIAAQALARAATARVTASRALRGAADLATEAVRLVPTEMPNLRADLLVELADILRASGDATGATRAIGEAIGLYEQKGSLVGAARAGEFLRGT